MFREVMSIEALSSRRSFKAFRFLQGGDFPNFLELRPQRKVAFHSHGLAEVPNQRLANVNPGGHHF